MTRPAPPADAVALLGGFAAVATVGLLAAVPGMVARRTLGQLAVSAPIEQTERRSVIAEAVARSGAGAVAETAGNSLQFVAGRGASATPVRSAPVSIVLVIAAVSGTLAFGVNFDLACMRRGRNDDWELGCRGGNGRRHDPH